MSKKKPPNIILITIDCLRADILGCYGGEAQTPSIDRLAEQGVRYTAAFAHSHMTKSTFPSIFSGRYPSQDGGTQQFDAERFSVVEALQVSGYQTIGVNSNPWLSRRFGFHRGYTRYVDLSEASPAAHSLPVRLLNHGLGLFGGGVIYPPYPSAQAVTDAALQAIDGVDAPFFLWLHYMDAHWPYDVDRPRLYGPRDAENWAYNARLAARCRQTPERVTARERDALWALYRRGVETVDRQLGRLLTVLDEADTVALTADHGEAFGEHTEYFHKIALHAENVHVPLLLRHSGASGGQVENGVVRHVDLAPTILETAVLPPPGNGEGISLLPAAMNTEPLPKLEAFSESCNQNGCYAALRHDGWAAILEMEDVARMIVRQESLYNYYDDPAETRNLALERPSRMAAMRARILDYIARRNVGTSAAPLLAADMDDDLKRQLIKLGYLE